GDLMQVGTPEEVYRDPTSLFVADFIGKINFFPAEVVGPDGTGTTLRLSGGDTVLATRRHELSTAEKEGFGVGAEAVVAVRPEHHTLSPLDEGAADGAAQPGVQGRVRRVLFLGSMTRYFVTCEGALSEVMVEAPRPVPGIAEGMAVKIGFAPSDAVAYVPTGAL